MRGSIRQNEGPALIASFINNTINDFNSMTNLLKNQSQSVSEINNHLKDKLLLANQADSKAIVKEMLTHYLKICELKGVQSTILTILVKIIGFIKLLERIETKQSLLQRNEEMGSILNAIINIILLLKSKSKQNDIILRIIQATYSLMDEKMLQFANYNLLTRLYSICFECCESSPTVQNISASALFALTEIVFSNQSVKDSLIILTQMLQYLFNGKHFLWIKYKQAKGMIWDLINVALKCFPQSQLQEIAENRVLIDLLILMYKTSTQKAFQPLQQSEKLDLQNQSVRKEENEKSINFKKGTIPQFIRYYKTFIYQSIYLYIRGNEKLKELIPFRQNLYNFKQLYEHQRNTRLYLFLEGLSLLLIEESYFLISQPQGIILIDVFNKVSEELIGTHQHFDIGHEAGDFYLEKMCGDFSRITDNDYAKLIKNTVLKLRKRLQCARGRIQEDFQSQNKKKIEEQHQSSNYDSLKKRWERLMKIILKIIRNLTSLNLKEGSNQQIVRKLVGQLQYWFNICPTSKIKNLILQDLLVSSTQLQTRIQSIKASQCVQIGSNIIYGYYDGLDSFGLAIIVRMLVGLKVNWQEGRGFDQLEEVCIMTQKLYTEQKLVNSPETFAKTIQAFVLCLNGLLADIQQPLKVDSKNSKKNHKKHFDRYFKMIEEMLIKIKCVIQFNPQYINKQWHFLTGFWVSLGSNKNSQIRGKMMSYLLPINNHLLKTSSVSQYNILSVYQELGKLYSSQISRQILIHMKHILLRITEEVAILQMFKVIAVLLQFKGIDQMHEQTYQMLEMIVKQSLFLVKDGHKLIQIINCINFISKDKSQQYKIVNLIWNISDHLKMLAETQEISLQKPVWKHLFQKFISITEKSVHVETKQSCNHAFTQILAQSIGIIGQGLFIEILEKQYFEQFSLLMSFTKADIPKVQNDKINTVNIDTIRVGIKNFIKITRKCMKISIKAGKDIFSLVIGRLQGQIAEKKSNMLEYLIEINVLLLYFQQIVQNDTEGFSAFRVQVHNTVVQTEKTHSQIDKSTYTWKKYFPVFEQLQAYFCPT